MVYGEFFAKGITLHERKGGTLESNLIKDIGEDNDFIFGRNEFWFIAKRAEVNLLFEWEEMWILSYSEYPMHILLVSSRYIGSLPPTSVRDCLHP